MRSPVPSDVELAHWRFGRRSGVLQGTDAAWALLGLPPRAGGITPRDICALLHAADMPSLFRSLRRTLRTGRADAIVRLPDGHDRRLLLRYTVDRDDGGRARAVSGVAFDITDAFDAAQHSSELSRRLEVAAAAL